VEKPEEAHLQELGVDGRIILKWILMKYFGRVLTGLMWLAMRVKHLQALLNTVVYHWVP
jgi:hypothetical protein